MTASQTAGYAAVTIKTYTFSMNPKFRKGSFGHEVSFEMNTTATRASTVVTRLKLIMAEAAPDKTIKVEKRINQPTLPNDRADIASWLICITIPIRERKKK